MQSCYRKYQAIGCALVLSASIAPAALAASVDLPQSGVVASLSAVTTHQPGLDAVRLLIVGSVYFGLAALIRKTI
jgi:hypothetical protein